MKKPDSLTPDTSLLTPVVELLFALFVAGVLTMRAFVNEPDVGLILLPLCVFAVFFLMRLFQRRFGAGFGIAPLEERRGALNPWLFLGVFLAVFLVCLWALLAYYPGGSTYDNYNQWNQIQTGAFDDWHPAFHSMIIWLFTRIVNRYAFFIGVQILFFSLMAGYMASTLRAWGVRLLWVAVFVLTLLSARSTRNILLFAWKDSLFTCLMLWLAIYIINILLSEGAWLRPWPNRAAFAAALTLVSIVRHNGIFVTIPLVLLLFALYGKKRPLQILTCAAMALAAVFLIRVPLYRIVGVTREDPDQTYVEAVGLPMTILCSVYTTQPEALDPEATALMETLAPPDIWKQYFYFGNYNSIKWVVDANRYVREVPPAKLLAMTLRACVNAPVVSLRSALVLTQFVWDPHIIDYSVDWWRTEDDYYVLPAGKLSITAEAAQQNHARAEAFRKPYLVVDSVIKAYTPSRALQSIGLNMLALALFAWFSLRRRRGWGALLPALPVIAYNVGTALMLCGSDYRFFQFNAVVTVPFLLVLSAKNQESGVRTGDEPPALAAMSIA